MNKILILDFGSQYTQLIARRIREAAVYCEIHPCTVSFEFIQNFKADALVLSGGPASVLSKGSPKVDKRVFEMGLPILGICYGMQLMSFLLGGKVTKSKKREYGKAVIQLPEESSILFSKLPQESVVWMSHGDSIEALPPGFVPMAHTNNGILAAMMCKEKHFYALQFHPEVVHTEHGKTILSNFLFSIAGLKATWNMSSFLEVSLKNIRDTVLKDKVILGLSGGVDSSVAAVLAHQAIGDQLICIFINNGLLRKNEDKEVREVFAKHYHIKLHYVDASRLFLTALKGVSDPEKKRKIIGRVFVRVFEREAKKIKGAKFLGQGTLYPDVIESVSFKGPSAVIKSHHNVGGLPKKMGLKLLEPFRELFKDEVRQLGKVLGMPDDIIHRHPFPGPGLAVRILGTLTKDRLDILREADSIVMEEIRNAGWYSKIWQAFAVLLPIKSVGVMGDERTYENVCAIRAVTSQDGMTADWVPLPPEVLGRISNRIINEVKGINRVVYDISSKPPATIEWE
ncbi:MAG TPA: GMP synthase (glutamine-hydrolyzing) [Deltaproteobacteria bacterium]|nr:MAG: glutamine-hydrolyzing GMP synthase [Deltaproteobacteria bacterium GWA2_45_12]HBF13856.1 GMP synthase (glutamine-hydrolyzing) [Deltaproteobacteria bacterium]